ncbi:SDR family NAD(P)-dependent oxidoreductase [Deinococcus apachensis]|uniref:SDR family NAD(P)-dependent oxidoreductase n=1 Tax=Deinococcus apachensis TaxID=309886 RepID=UPI00035EE3F9|nr:SDR family oxidoreductase [Deinococcus apachensis]
MTQTQKTTLTRTALVTGASGGIGEALARGLATRGIDVILVARTESKLQALARELEAAHGVRAFPVPLDLTLPDAGERLEREVGELGLTVDFLVNNAGFASYGEFITSDPGHERDMIQVNVVTLTDLTRRFLPGMVARGRGRVLNVASTAAFMPGPLMAVYYATKAYVLSFSEALNEEVRGSGVNVTALCPGPVETGFQSRARLEESRLLQGREIMGPGEVAREGIDAMLRGQAVRVVGRANQLLALTPRFLPRALVPGLVKRAQDRAH